MDLIFLLILLLVVCTLSLIIQIRVNRVFKNRYNTYHRVPGKIVSQSRHFLDDNSEQTYDNIQYFTLDGQLKFLKSKYRVGNIDKKKNIHGEALTYVYYNPDNPDEAYQDIKTIQYLPLLVGAILSFILIMYVIILFLK